MPGNVNIRKVAAAAGVSAPIVSAVLGGKDPLHGNVRFSKETAEKIKHIAAEMGYVSNRLAKVLIRRETFAIGVLAPFERHERYDAIIRALSEKCQSKAYHLIVTSCSFSHEDQMAKLRSLMSLQVNIVVMIPVASEKIDPVQVMKEHEEKQKLFPNLLCVDWFRDELVFDCAEPDARLMIELPLRHLKERGHRFIGMIGACSKKRYDILMETLAALDMEETSEALLTGFRPFNVSERDVPELTRKILSLSPRPTALYCWNDSFAASAYRVCEREFGLKIGKDIALIGQDNTAIAKSLPVPLTSFDLKDKELASVLFDIIEAKIESMDGQSPLRKTVTPELVIRESSSFKLEM